MKYTGGVYSLTENLLQSWLGYKADTLHSAAFNVNGQQSEGLPLQNKKWPLRIVTKPGQKCVHIQP